MQDPASPFLAGKKRPKGLPDSSGKRAQDILQTEPQTKSSPYFFSLFDTDENTPFYSAYKVIPRDSAKLGKFGRDDLKIDNKPPKWRDPTGTFIVKKKKKIFHPFGEHVFN